MRYTLLSVVYFAQFVWQESTAGAEGPLPLQSHQTSGCYGNGDLQRDFINAGCEDGERIAMYTIQHASKPRSTACPTEMLNGTLQECCVPEIGDCAFRLPHNNTRNFFTSCTGYRSCITPVRISRSRLVVSPTCSTTEHLQHSNYLIANFYCIAESSMVYMDDTTKRTGKSFYLAHTTYPDVTKSTPTKTCYVSSSCEEVIHIMVIDLHLNCSTWIELMDGGRVTNLSCSDNNDYYMRTIYTSSSSAVAIRSMGGGPLRFWLYIQASRPDSSVTVTCGRVDMAYTHNVCSSSSMDISSKVYDDESWGTYISTYDQLEASSLGAESGLDTYSRSERELEPSISWSDAEENSFENDPTRDFGNMETDFTITESGDIFRLYTNDRLSLDFGIVSLYKPNDVFIQDTMLHPGLDASSRGSGSNVHGLVSEHSGYLPIPSTDMHMKTITMTQTRSVDDLFTSAIGVDRSDKLRDESKFNTNFFESCSTSTCRTKDLTTNVKKTIHLSDTANFVALSDVHPVLSTDLSKSRHETLPSALPTDGTQSLTTFRSTVPATSGSPAQVSAILGGTFGSVIGVVIIALGIIFRRKICNNKVVAEKDVEGVDDGVQEGSHKQNDVSESTNPFSGKPFLPNTQILPLVTKELDIPRNDGESRGRRLPPLHGPVPSRGLLNNDTLLQPLGHSNPTIPSASAFTPRTVKLPALKFLHDTPPNILPDIESVSQQFQELGIYADVTLHDSTPVMEQEAAKKGTKKREKKKHKKSRSDEILIATERAECSTMSHLPSGENLPGLVDSLDNKKKRKRKHKKRQREEQTSTPVVEEVEDEQNLNSFDI